jgi:two-component system, cell cycle sensor histidine kinase and response regulator CckA
LELIREEIAREVKVPMIMVTGRGRFEIDVEAMRAGAADYLSKDQLNSPFLERTIRYALERRRVEEELDFARALLHARNPAPIGSNPCHIVVNQ